MSEKIMKGLVDIHGNLCRFEPNAPEGQNLGGVSVQEKENWNNKQNVINDLEAIRSGAAAGATALQSFTEADPTVPSHVKSISADDIASWNAKAEVSDIPTVPSSGYLVRITYNSTPASEIQAILDAGNTPYIIYNNNTYYYQDISPDNYYRFVSVTPGSTSASDPPIIKRIYKKVGSESGNWGNGTLTLYDQNHKPTASDVGALPSTTAIPSALSDLTDDATHRVVTDTEKAEWSRKQDAISNLSTIASGAAAGATALQPGDLADWAKADSKPSYNLSELAEDDTHKLVTATQISSWTSAATNNHTHDNKTVLDGITAEKIAGWESSEPAAYIKSASVSGNTLTLTNKDDTTTTFTPEGGGGGGTGGGITFAITEDMVTVSTDATKGVAPYSTSYGYTNIEISADSGIEWVNGGVYSFVVNTKMVVASGNRNVRIRIGSDDAWHPVMSYTTSILAGNTYFVKNMTVIFIYKNTIRTEGALHLPYDSNTTYAYLVNTIASTATVSPINVDSNGVGSKSALLFATTVPSVNEKWSTLVTTSSSAATKSIVIPASGKFYIDRKPLYMSGTATAGEKPSAAMYLDYQGMDLRYTANVTNAYCTAGNAVYLYLKNFNEADYSFEADAGDGMILTRDKLSTKFPTSGTDDIYLWHMGWTTGTWYSLSPLFGSEPIIYRYTPSSEALTRVRTMNSYNITSSGNNKNVYISTAQPDITWGNEGDIWIMI